jgi:hypothetical protein
VLEGENPKAGEGELQLRSTGPIGGEAGGVASGARFCQAERSSGEAVAIFVALGVEL